jgi:hypothetical protein
MPERQSEHLQKNENDDSGFNLLAEPTEVRPGDTVKFSASGLPAGVGVSIVDEEFYSEPMVTEGDVYVYEEITPSWYSGTRTFCAVAVSGDQLLLSNAVEIVIKPDLSTLQFMKFEPEPNAVYSEGSKFSPVVTGYFSDGKEYDISAAELGTIYSTGNSDVAAVSEKGEITALKPGEAVISAINADCGALLYLTVTPFDVRPGHFVEETDPEEPSGSDVPDTPDGSDGPSGSDGPDEMDDKNTERISRGGGCSSKDTSPLWSFVIICVLALRMRASKN